MHRYTCAPTLPPHKYGNPEIKIHTLEKGLDDTRRHFLWTRGVVFARLPTPQRREDGDFHEVIDPLPRLGSYTEAIWYGDGSKFGGTWAAFRAAGFCIVATTPDGQLLGHGF